MDAVPDAMDMPEPSNDAPRPATGPAGRDERVRSLLHEPLDAEARPEGLPVAWERLDWRQLAPFRHACKARVFAAEAPPQRVVCKDYSYGLAHGSFRWARRMALRNELRALRRLAGVPGIPTLLGAWGTGFAMGWVSGRRLGDFARDGVPEEVFDALDRLLASIHARGVLIVDLHRRNVMVDDDRSVSLVDFEAALVMDRGVGRLVRQQLRRMDEYSAVKQRVHYGAPLNADQQRLLERPPGLRRVLGRVKSWQRARRKRRMSRS